MVRNKGGRRHMQFIPCILRASRGGERGRGAGSFPPYWFSKLKYNAYKYTFEAMRSFALRLSERSRKEVRCVKSEPEERWTVRVGKGWCGGGGRSIVTYIKIPISRLVITSTVYHAKQGRWTEVSKLAETRQTEENLESTEEGEFEIKRDRRSSFILHRLIIIDDYVYIFLFSYELSFEHSKN